MAATVEVECFAVVDRDGNSAVGGSLEAAREKYEEDVGPLNECEGFRVVKSVITVTLPEVVTLTGTAGQDAEALLAVI